MRTFNYVPDNILVTVGSRTAFDKQVELKRMEAQGI
jgi:hypothetical protein